MLKRLYVYSLLIVAFAIDSIALLIISGIHLTRLFSAAVILLAASFFLEGLYLFTRGRILSFLLGVFFILLFASFLYILRNYIGIEINLITGAFILISLILAFLVILVMQDSSLMERIYTYIVLAFLTATFQFSYAFIAIYLSYKAAIDNLGDTGKLSKIKKPLTYLSGPLLALTNIALLTLEALGVYKPNKNIYLIALTVLITTLLATRKLLSSVPEGRIGKFIYLALPALVALYTAGYTLYKIYPRFSPLDGLAKALATTAGIIAYKERRKDFIST